MRVVPAALVAVAGLVGAASAGVLVELELVLAVDASSSIDDGEFALQMQGIASAFRHPDVQAAIDGTDDRGIAVALIQWSDFAIQRKTVDWTLVRDTAGAVGLANHIAAAGRAIPGGATAIYGVINLALHELDTNGYDGRRRVIDVSGDGRSDLLVPTTAARDRAVAHGVAINGLVILNDEPDLDRYYRQNVIGGTKAFVLTADGFDSFAAAIVAKLIREITDAPAISSLPPPAIGLRRPMTAGTSSSTGLSEFQFLKSNPGVVHKNARRMRFKPNSKRAASSSLRKDSWSMRSRTRWPSSWPPIAGTQASADHAASSAVNTPW